MIVGVRLEENVANRQADIAPRVFLAVGNRRVIRAERAVDSSWTVETVLGDPSPVTLAADPNDTGSIYAGTQGDGIYHSGDQGRSWTRLGLAGQIVKSIAVSPHDSRVIYAGVKPAAVYKSEDTGRTWIDLEGFRHIPNRWWWFSPAEAPFKAYVMALSVSPTEPDVVLAGIELGAVVRSEDGGRTWSRHLRGTLRDCHSLRFHGRDGQWAYEAGGSGGGASFSRDGGRTWRKQKTGLEKHYGVACAADPQRPEVWYVSVASGPGKAYGENAEGYIYRASAGSGWQPIGWEPHPMGGMPAALATHPAAPGHLYAGTTRGEIWHTSDYGDTWQRLLCNLGNIGLSMLLL